MNQPAKKLRLVQPDMEFPDKVNITREGKTRAKFRTLIRGSIEDVWHEMTRTDRTIPAFFDTQMHVAELTKGSKLAMRTADGRYTAVVGEILECDPPRRFVHTFKFTNFDDPECVCEFDLEEVEGGVQFTLTIRDLPDGTKTAKQMLQGGKLIVGTFKAVVETGRPSFGTRMLFVLFKLMAFMTPKICRTENWPIDGEAGAGRAKS